MTALYANYNEQSGTEDIEEYCRGISIAVIKPWLNQVTAHPGHAAQLQQV